jgi:squid-like protein
MSNEEQEMKTEAVTVKVEENEMDTTEVVNDEDERKLFVGGLPQDVKDSDLKTHFSTFGEIEGINLKTDPNTGRSRGFGFVIYKSVDGVEKAVAQEEHEINGKKVAVKKAQAKQGKIYVGKLKPEITDEEIKEFFAAYGTIATLEQPYDKTKNERKNFCFITYEKEETAKKLLKEGTVSINGHELEVKKVTPKGDGRGGGFGGRGGRGGPGGPGGWGGNYGWPAGYGDYYGGWGGYSPADYYAGWGGYGAGWGPYPAGGAMPYGAGGKSPRGAARGGGPGGAPRGRGVGAARGGQRSKPY